MIKRDLVVAHGFNVPDGGAATINKVIPAFNGSVQKATYGWFGIASVLFFNDNIAAMVAGMATPGSVGVGHSNGCAVLTRATNLGAPMTDLILLNPALEEGTEFAEHLNSIHVYHNKGDVPVRLAKLLNKVIPGDFMWGEMGRDGYSGNDPRVINHDVSDIYCGHADIFSDEQALVDMLIADFSNK